MSTPGIGGQPQRGRALVVVLAVAVGVLIVGLAVTLAVFLPADETPRPAAISSVAGTPDATSTWAPTARPAPEPSSSAPPTVPPVGGPPPAGGEPQSGGGGLPPEAAGVVDDGGFIGSGARCQSGDSILAALATNEGSQVVVCGGRSGPYYIGYRAKLGATKPLPAQQGSSAGTFVAKSAGTTYDVSPTGLVITLPGGKTKSESKQLFVAGKPKQGAPGAQPPNGEQGPPPGAGGPPPNGPQGPPPGGGQGAASPPAGGGQPNVGGEAPTRRVPR